WHPMHLHGHSFRVISRNGKPNRFREWRDTVLVPPRETVEIAFIADNPGDWMFHCHVTNHQEAGMMGVIRIARTVDNREDDHGYVELQTEPQGADDGAGRRGRGSRPDRRTYRYHRVAR